MRFDETNSWKSPVLSGLIIGLGAAVLALASTRGIRPAEKSETVAAAPNVNALAAVSSQSQSPLDPVAAVPNVKAQAAGSGQSQSPPKVLREAFHEGGMTAYRKGRYADAERLFRQAVEAGDAVHAEDQTQGDSLSWLVEALWQQGKYAEVEAIQKRVIAVCENAFGPTSKQVSDSLRTLAMNCENQERVVEAEALYLKSIKIDEAVGGVASSFVFAITCQSLARLYEQKGESYKASDFHQRALMLLDEMHEKDSIRVNQNVLEHYVRAYVRGKQFPPAIAAFELLRSIRKKKTYTSYGLGHTCRLIGDACFEMNKLDEAERCYQQALEFYEDPVYNFDTENGKSEVLASSGSPIKKFMPWNISDVRLRLARTWLRLNGIEKADSVLSRVGVKDLDEWSLHPHYPGVADIDFHNGLCRLFTVPSVLTEHGDRCMKERRFADAEQAFRNASLVDGGKLETRMKLSEARRAQGIDDKIEIAESFISRPPCFLR